MRRATRNPALLAAAALSALVSCQVISGLNDYEFVDSTDASAASGGIAAGGSSGKAAAGGVGATTAGGAGGSSGGGGSDGGGSGGTGGVAGGGGESGSGTGGTGGTSTPASCAAYCATVTTNCVGPEEQYPSDSAKGWSNNSVCIAVCAQLPLGFTSDTSTDTVGCRAHYANSSDCYQAGPAPAGACGTSCESYCDIMLKKCGAAYSGLTACMLACQALPDATAINYTSSGPTPKTGATLACRLYWASFAAIDTGYCSYLDYYCM